MFGLFKKKQVEYFSPEEKDTIVEAIRKAEQRTSGEVRIYVEAKCPKADPVQRAGQIFFKLKMNQTAARNGVLLYLAMEDHRLAVYGDQGIHESVGDIFWQNAVDKMLAQFNQQYFVEGIVQIIADIGTALETHFPYDEKGDKNELPDDIVFGK